MTDSSPPMEHGGSMGGALVAGPGCGRRIVPRHPLGRRAVALRQGAPTRADTVFHGPPAMHATRSGWPRQARTGMGLPGGHTWMSTMRYKLPTFRPGRQPPQPDANQPTCLAAGDADGELEPQHNAEAPEPGWVANGPQFRAHAYNPVICSVFPAILRQWTVTSAWG